MTYNLKVIKSFKEIYYLIKMRKLKGKTKLKKNKMKVMQMEIMEEMRTMIIVKMKNMSKMKEKKRFPLKTAKKLPLLHQIKIFHKEFRAILQNMKIHQKKKLFHANRFNLVREIN